MFNNPDFIRIFDEIPAVRENFSEVAVIGARERWDWSENRLDEVYRDGWFVNAPIRSLEDAETIQGHKTHLRELIRRYFPEHMQDTLSGYADVHDNQESIAHAIINGVRRDLNPRFNKTAYSISEKDKEMIEEAAIRFLLDGDQSRLETWYEYKNKESEVSQEFSALDKICVMWKCVDWVEGKKFPYTGFERFWEYWSLDNVREKLPNKIISKAYEEDLYPRIQSLRHS